MRLNAEQVAEYEHKGYVVLPELFTAAEVTVLNGAMEAVTRSEGPHR